MHALVRCGLLLVLAALPPAGAAVDPIEVAQRVHLTGPVTQEPMTVGLLVLEPREGWGHHDLEEMRSFVTGGGRLLLVGVHGSGRGLLDGLELNATVPQAGLVALEVEEGVQAQGAGEWAGSGSFLVPPPVSPIEGDGEPLLITTEFTWVDLDNDGEPDLGEPRGAQTIAMRFDRGAGAVLVITARDVFASDASSEVEAAALRWLTEDGTRTLVWHAGHESGDPLISLAETIASRQDTLTRLAAVVLVLGVAVAVLGFRLKRRPDARRRVRPLPPVQRRLERVAIEELDP